MMKTFVSLLLLITPMVAASGLRGPQDDDAIFCHLFVATGSEAEEHGDETFVKYQCLFEHDESRRRHEIDLPEAFLKEHQSRSSHPRRGHHDAFRSNSRERRHHDPRRDFSPAPIGS
jgi:hypothetical protein